MQGFEGKKIAILIADGFEKKIFDKVRKSIDKAGGHTYVISPEMGKVESWDSNDWDSKYKIDLNLMNAEASYYDALFIPDGILHVEKLKKNANAISFIRQFVYEKKPIALIGNSQWILTETELLKDRQMTSARSVMTDLVHAGVEWKDEEIVIADQVVSARHDADPDVFINSIAAQF